MVPRLVKRPKGYSREPGKVTGQITAEAFGQITSGRRTRSTDLAAIIEIAGYRSCGSKFNHATLKFASKLPGNQILVAPYSHRADASRLRARTWNPWNLGTCSIS